MRPYEDKVLLLVLGAVVVLLTVASGIALVWKRVAPGHEINTVARRIWSWWGIFLVFSVAVLPGLETIVALFCLLGWLSAHELVEMRKMGRRERALICVAMPCGCLAALFTSIANSLLIMMIAFLVVMAAADIMSLGRKRIVDIAVTLFVSMFLLGHGIYLFALAQEADLAAGRVLFLVVLLTELNDVAQYLWGKAIGRRPVAPRWSPAKTWSGLIGGVATTLALTTILAPLLSFNRWQGMVAGLLIGLGGFAGDLMCSAIKRNSGVKDSGTLLPGHGGILDRVDSLCLSVPLFTLFFCYTEGLIQ